MPQFKPKGYYSRKKKPEETAVVEPQEKPTDEALESAPARPQETPVGRPKQICGINGCQTWYDNPKVMERHRARVHGIGIENINKPEPRHADVKLA